MSEFVSDDSSIRYYVYDSAQISMNQLFSIGVSRHQLVSDLKNAIGLNLAQETIPTMTLWRAQNVPINSCPTRDFIDWIRSWKGAVIDELAPHMRICDIFPDGLPSEYAHIVVALFPSTVTLNYYVLGNDGLTKVFCIEVRNSISVRDLAEQIRKEKRYQFSSSLLELWQVSIPIESESTHEPDERVLSVIKARASTPKLRLTYRYDPPHDEIQIIVKLPNSYKFNYYIRGTAPMQTFDVEVPASENVDYLRKKICLTSLLPDLNEEDLQLWLLKTPFSLDDSDGWQALRLTDCKRLSTLSPFEKLFREAPDKGALHFVLVHQPKISISCWLHRNTIHQVTTVELDQHDTVLNIKNRFVAARSLDAPGHLQAHIVSPHIEEVAEELDANLTGPILLDEQKIFDIVMTLPVLGDFCIIFREPLQSLDQSTVYASRMEYVEHVDSKAPSDRGKPSNFVPFQKKKEDRILCNRPPDAVYDVPVALLHPIFGKFLDECQTGTITAEDQSFASRLSTEMSQFFGKESERQHALIQLFADHGIYVRGGVKVGQEKYSVDGALSARSYNYMLVEIKDEVGKGAGSEPYIKASFYFLESTRHILPNFPDSEALPCLILLIFGPYITFVGAAWAHRPITQPLSGALALHYHPTDIRQRDAVARHLAALRAAIYRLEDHYNKLVPQSPPLKNGRPNMFPYPTTFASNGAKHKFRYIKQYSSGRLLYFGKLEASTEHICIKFVRTYSKNLHEICSDMKHAPRLRGFEEIPGGWTMVVMDAIAPTYIRLCDALEETEGIPIESKRALFKGIESVLSSIHSRGYVHGDFRDTNIMVKISPHKSKFEFMIVDFDWAGEIGKAQYPANVYRGSTLWRPENARDYNLIQANDDIEMLRHMRGAYMPDED